MKHYFTQRIENIKAAFHRAQKGFTLMETLMTVGILSILLAVSIPGVITIQKNLNMKELDDIARQIFLGAQGQLTEMKSNDRLVSFEKDLSPAYSNQNLGILNKRPSDYEKVGTDDLKWKDFYYLNDTDAVMEKYVIKEVSALGAYLEGGSFIVELNPKTGDVYGAFYSSKTGLTYDDITSLSNRGKDARTPPQIGYYGGEAGSSASSTLPGNFLPTLEVVNAEDLYLKFECSNLQALFRTQKYLEIALAAEDESGTVWTKTLKASSNNFSVDATGNMSTCILFDSLRTGEDFETLTELKAGDDIKVTATLSYNNTIDPVVTGVATQIFNSLFEEKTIADGVTKLKVSRVRHLNNLRQTKYKPENVPATGKVEISQSLNIDFLAENWKDDSSGNPAIVPGEPKKNPLTKFNTIVNSKLLSRNDTASAVAYNGGGNSISNFPLAAPAGTSKDVGLFSSAQNMTFEDMRLIDFSVNGTYDEASKTYGAVDYDNVGMLAGTLTNCKLKNVYAHLSTDHGIKMPERLLQYNINTGSGNTNVGGLIGSAVVGSTVIEGSLAAVPISSGKNIGGLVGSFAGGKITNSYGSGSINANSSAGGLVGVISGGAEVKNCYSTSNVTANSYAGGLVGQTIGAAVTFEDSRSYGLVRKNETEIDAATSGPFIGRQSNNNSYNNCFYLQQGSYNAGYNPNGKGTPALHSELIASAPNTVDKSHPYNVMVLENKIFPFPMLTDVGHYGDWVEATTMQTSLVYYEKYADDEYGYYAKTSLSTIGDETEGADEANLWVVDTLRDQPCIEDGYALMTIFKLTGFNCKLENGAVQNIITNEAGEAGENKSPLIQKDVTVQFKKADGSSATQEIDKAKVYQLPFNLQVADRIGEIKRFFLKLNINGYAGENKVIDNFSFYYCPDFAKNAVNPKIGDTDISTYPMDPGGEEHPVYVRSPRQLNGLSRYNYYWNEGNNGGKKFYFKQETELNYGTYVKEYCGVEYDLMDTEVSNPYRNRPIGRPIHKTGGQFRNIYDGNFKRIIDYRCEVEDYQFVGLFGEVCKCELKNIVMTASKPGGEKEASSAYVKSDYSDNTYKSGTGALVGLIYVAPEESYDDTEAKVTNCFVSGYDVSTSDGLDNDSVVGGLVGYNFGIIKNSSANNKTVSAGQKGSRVRYLGGLVGSINGRGIIENCYAGGLLKSKSSNIFVGGLVGGFDDLYGYGQNKPDIRDQRVRYSYSHCTWKDEYLKKGTFYPCVPKEDKISVNNCYYLTNSAEQKIKDKFDTKTDASEGKNATELREMAAKPADDELPDFGKAANTYPWYIKGKNYPFPAIVKDNSGRLLHYGDWYNTDIDMPSAIFTYYERYRDEKGVESYGFQFVETSGIEELNNLKDNTFKIIEAGYVVLVLKTDEEKSAAAVLINNEPIKLTPYTVFYTTEGGDEYQLYSLGDINILPPPAKAAVVLSYNEISGEGKLTPKNQWLYVNLNFAATVALKQNASNADNPTQVRTERQLRNLSTGAPKEYYKMTHNIVIENFGGEATGNLINNDYTFDGGYAAGDKGTHYYYINRWVGGNGNYIFGLTAPLFSANAGTIKNTALLGVNVQSNDAAALAVASSGAIDNCFAQGDVTGGGSAAGLVHTNSGTVQRSYFSGNVTSAGFASGFVFTNSGSISNCYTVGEVKAGPSSAASGFVNINSGSIRNSYSAMNIISGGTKFGFTATENTGTFDGRYWLKDGGINDALGRNIGTTQLYFSLFGEDLLKEINTDGVWSINCTAYPYPKDGHPLYPYPSLASQDHYGNWPIQEL